MPKLELISRQPAGPARPFPLLFVHGAFCGAAFWDVHLLGHAAAHGYAAHAVSLRGHGASEGRSALPWASLSDYVDDLAQTVAQIEAACGQTPALIGHSMGGVVVQRYMARNPVPAVVLMASAPPTGLAESSIGLALRSPFLFQQMLALQTFGSGMISLSAIRQALFTNQISDAEIQRYLPFLQAESQRIAFDMMAPGLIPSATVAQPPILVIGGRHDALVTPDQVETTARAYGVTPVFFPDCAHNLVLENGWRAVGDTALDWLDTELAQRGEPLAAAAQ
ncbi:MAG: alpha/beta fold hydrolase [Azospirillaceae bacterium]|nr:alpha/beta fold hydrolase [Azospirillaceae bacterium]